MTRLACIDIGTVTARLAVADVEGGRVVRLAKHSEICNLGQDVDATGRLNDEAMGRVLACVRAHDLKLVGLSALMTTTVKSMQETIELIHREEPEVRVFVGGAVLTAAYARAIGADFYAKDAAASARIAEQVLG